MVEKHFVLFVCCSIVGCFGLGDPPGLRPQPQISDGGADSTADDAFPSGDGDVSSIVDASPKIVRPKADFDADGRADLYCRTGDGRLLVALSDASGMPSWQEKPWITGWCASPSAVGTGDFDDDERSDLYCQDEATHSLSTALSRRVADSDSFVADGSPRATFDCSPGSVFTGDFDGDGTDDVICHDGESGSKTFATSWVMTSGKGFGDLREWLTLWCGKNFGVADFDGDGKTDLWCHGNNEDLHARGKTWIALSTGTGFADTTKVSESDVDWASEGFCNTIGSEFTAGDFDGDGRADLLCHNPNRAGADLAYVGEVWVAPAKGLNGPGTVPSFPKSDWTKYRSKWCAELDATIGFGDFDGDGRLDAFCRSSTGTTISLASTGTFVDKPTLLGGCTGPGSELGSAVAVRPN